MPSSRNSIQQREQGRAAVRALYLTELEDVRQKRVEALRVAEEQLDRVARLLSSALEAGITMSEISRATEINRPTLYQLRGRYSENEGDVELAVLQAVAVNGIATDDEVCGRVGAAADRLHDKLQDLLDRGFLDLVEDSDDGTAAFALSDIGLMALEGWTFRRGDDVRGEDE